MADDLYAMCLITHFLLKSCFICYNHGIQHSILFSLINM